MTASHPQETTAPPRCKCGDSTCQLWRDTVVCTWCSAELDRIESQPDFEGRAGDMGEGHYPKCPHGAAARGLRPIPAEPEEL